MVGSAARRRDGAVGEGAALVAGDECEALGRGEKPGFPAEVQDLPVGAEERGDDVGIGGNFAQRFGGDGTREGEVSRP